jgi:hypothetical protein
MATFSCSALKAASTAQLEIPERKGYTSCEDDLMALFSVNINPPPADRRHKWWLRKSDNLLTRKGGGEGEGFWARSQIIRRREAWSSIIQNLWSPEWRWHKNLVWETDVDRRRGANFTLTYSDSKSLSGYGVITAGGIRGIEGRVLREFLTLEKISSVNITVTLKVYINQPIPQGADHLPPKRSEYS